jgi:hypothetical protein
LLRQHAAGARHRRHRLEIRQGIAPGGELVVPALAGQQRPASPAPGAVIGAPVIVLAIAVAVVAVPDRAAGCVGLEQGIRNPDRIEDQPILGTAQAFTPRTA